MALLERVATLIKANLNDLIDRAEDPEKLLKQLLLDLDNQYMQVKTQVAIAVADEHLLQRKQRENLEAQQDWLRKAEMAVAQGDDELARAAIGRALACENAVKNFAAQVEDQSHQLRRLREALHHLEQKTTEARAKADVLMAQHRRARLETRSGLTAEQEMGTDAAFQRLKERISERADRSEVERPGIERRFEEMEKADKIESLLANLKAKREP